MGRRHNDVTDQQIVATYNDTLSAYKTADLLGINWKKVYRTLVHAGVATKGLHHYRKEAKKFSDETEKEILKEYEAGTSGPALAKKYGSSAGTVALAIERQGGKMRPWQGRPTKLTDEEKEEIIEKYESGMPLTALALEYKAHNSTIREILVKLGMIIRAKPRTRRGRYMTTQGYVEVTIEPDHPYFCMGNHRGRVAEHRLVMAQKLGRVLNKKETVHHIDGDKTNNDPDNLEVRHGKHGKNVVLCCLDCGSQNIGPASLNSH